MGNGLRAGAAATLRLGAGGGGDSGSPATGMEGQGSPLLNGVAPDHPLLNGVAPDPLIAADETHPPAQPSGTDAQTPLLDAVMLEPPAVAEELPVQDMEEDVLPSIVDASSEAPEEDAGGVVLNDDLRDQIVKQVEYYFSDENLPTNEFLSKFVKKNKQGFVPIRVIASFRKMKKLVQDHAIIEAALRTSSKLVVSPDGKWIRRLRPLPYAQLKDAKQRTVVVENLPPDFSMESLQEKFGAIGKIVTVTVNDPCSVKESAKPKNVDFILRSKVHALVEYEAVEAAEKAASTLNDATNWRTGLKVTLITKRSVTSSGKYNQISKEDLDLASKWSELNQPAKKKQNMSSEKNSSADSAEGSTNKENMISALTAEDELQHKMSKGGRKGRYRGQGKSQIQQNAKGHGDSGAETSNKPIPGPRMPDGTRGFTMGRGRPLPLQKS